MPSLARRVATELGGIAKVDDGEGEYLGNIEGMARRRLFLFFKYPNPALSMRAGLYGVLKQLPKAGLGFTCGTWQENPPENYAVAGPRALVRLPLLKRR